MSQQDVYKRQVRDLTKVGVEISYTANPEVLTLTLK